MFKFNVVMLEYKFCIILEMLGDEVLKLNGFKRLLLSFRFVLVVYNVFVKNCIIIVDSIKNKIIIVVIFLIFFLNI